MTRTTTLIPVTPDQRPLIANLIQLYLYDMTDTMPFTIGSDGRFEYGFLDRFWRFPYLIYSGDEIAGFALVVDECPLTDQKPCWFMAEFFVLKAYRRCGVGRVAVAEALLLHPGPWHIGVPKQNLSAQAFWTSAIHGSMPLTRDISFEGDQWTLHEFDV